MSEEAEYNLEEFYPLSKTTTVPLESGKVYKTITPGVLLMPTRVVSPPGRYAKFYKFKILTEGTDAAFVSPQENLVINSETGLIFERRRTTHVCNCEYCDYTPEPEYRLLPSPYEVRPEVIELKFSKELDDWVREIINNKE